MSLRRYVIALGCASTFVAPATALAHASLDRSKPARGAVVSPAPKEVTLWFTEAIEPKFSSIVVREARGTTVQDGTVQPDPSNTAQLRVPLRHIGPGTYTVIWRVLSVDTHRSRGEFSFRVGR